MDDPANGKESDGESSKIEENITKSIEKIKEEMIFKFFFLTDLNFYLFIVNMNLMLFFQDMHTEGNLLPFVCGLMAPD